MMNTNILALDQATHCGWATSSLSGVENFSPKRSESPGMRFLRFEAWLKEIIKLHKTDVIIFEQPHHRGGASTEIAYGFVTIIKTVAAKNNIETMTVHSTSLKKFITGSGKANKKDMMKAASRFRGKIIKDDNEADAICMHRYACTELGIEMWTGKRKIRRRKKWN